MKNNENLMGSNNDFAFGFPFGFPFRLGLPISMNDDSFDIPKLSKLFLNSFKSDVQETEANYIVEVELAGFTKENIEINFEKGILKIAAKRDNVNRESDKKYLVKERSYENCERCYYFENVEEQNITASFDNGILKIILPKKRQEQKKNTNISIK